MLHNMIASCGVVTQQIRLLQYNIIRLVVHVVCSVVK
jgi:hypothetical protein